jgi:hypothetical protein
METYEIDTYSDLPTWAKALMYIVMIPIALIVLVAFLLALTFETLNIFKHPRP